MSEPKGYFSPEYLQAAGELLMRNKQRSYQLMRVQPGNSVLDVGCGAGIDTVMLAQLVGSDGHIAGVDRDPSMIAEADQRAERAGVSRWVKHLQSDATTLPFADQSFDSCRSERVFQHLPRPDLTLTEMVRVTKPGGWLIVLDPDWGTTSVDCADLDVERRLARIRAEICLENGYAGRQLFRMFQQQGLVEISVEIFPSYLTNYYFAREIGFMDRVEAAALEAGVVTEDEIRTWRDNLEQADAQGVFFVTTSSMLVAGRKITS